MALLKNTNMSTTGVIHVHTTLNNTIISLTSLEGNVFAWASAGSLGFKGSRRSTSYAAQAVAEKIGKECVAKNFELLHVHFKGVGYGKESSLKGLQRLGLRITKIEDKTRMPFNGCRPPKKRRV